MRINAHIYCVGSKPCRFSSSNMASSSSVKLASMLPMSFSTSAGSARCERCCCCCCDWLFVLTGVGDGCGGMPGRDFIGGYSAGRPPVRVLIVPAFSLAKGKESDSVLELDCNNNKTGLVNE